MPLYRDEIVVLRTHKLGEADRIVTMLSRQHGKIRAVAKGVRRTQSKFGARLEPFMVADAQFFEGRTLDIITQAESIASYGALIAADYGSYTAASAMVETADRVTEDEGSLQQYLLLVGALRSLSRREHGASLTLDSYLLRSLSMAGWAPSFQDCAVTGAPGPHSAFVVQLGGVVADAAAPPGSPRLDPDTLALLSALLTGDWPHAEAATLRSQARASGVVAAYAQWHLDRGIRSLGLVDRSDARQLLPPTEQPVPLDAPDLDGADPDPAAALAAATASVVRATPRDADPDPDALPATPADRPRAQETTR
ncbi:DNA repair protein RecO [Clavibacter michiganensis subsp. michiganensis]|nr:DNA repair protein RecO [Clavibacter michiganensis subsp. michiganensis]OUE13042.1 DNA repair protein RecO [Clavibacter michiganensis subsp. michiganensis]UQZ31340.1 DNA repair protein RecO [Clavibacter michiganensis subsp. michiganensis]